jgi:hypothetical protein
MVDEQEKPLGMPEEGPPSTPETLPVPAAERFPVRHRYGLIATACYLFGAFWVYARLWLDPAHRLVGDGQDHQLFIWNLAQAAHSVSHLTNPLFSTTLNVPGGVNLMTNTSVLGLGIPLTPVTLLFGPQVTFALLGLISLAGTAGAWYFVFSRRLVQSRVAAIVGGGVCGFAPGMIAHAPGHLHIIAQFVLPFLLLYVIKLAEGTRPLRDGIVLGLLITYQVFLSEEMLLLAAMGCGGFVLVYAVLRFRSAGAMLWPLVRGLLVAGAVAGVLLAYPLWFQFLGPRHSRGLPFETSDFITNALAYVTFPSQSVGGWADPKVAVHLANNYGEENSFFGLPLMLVLIGTAVWLWRVFAVRLLASTAAVFMALSLGSHLRIGGHQTRIPGPFLLLSKLPVVDMALATRLSLLVVPMAAALLALCVDRMAATGRRSAGAPVGAVALPARLLNIAVIAVALVPLVPIPLHAFEPPAIPAFITSGTWKLYVPAGRTLVPVPLPRSESMDGMRWQADSGMGFALPQGFFIGPDGTAAQKAVFVPPTRPTADLLREVGQTGNVPAITEGDRRQAVEDLAFWRASVVVLTPHANEKALRTTLDALLGSGRLVDGAWIWNVRTMID